MMKFFRKHHKKLLAVFMVLLMIVFLGGSALDSLLRPSGDRVVATCNAGDISYSDHRVAEARTRILSMMGLPWEQPFSGMAEPLTTLDWILLTREAKLLGTALNLKPVLELRDGRVEPLEKVRTKGKANARVIELVAERVAGKKDVRIAALHANTEAEASEMLQAAVERCNPVETHMSVLSPVIGTHAGPGTVGLVYYTDS